MSNVNIRLAAAVSAVGLSLFFWPYLIDEYETIAFTFDPTATRAAAYGERHFGAVSALYDVERAEYFYQQAATLDPNYPFVYHQLARLEFLKGNFNTALFYIDKQIGLHGDSAPNSYYMRGLIEGYMGEYDAAATDYAHYLSLLTVSNWAGINDYAWVLLKAGRAKEAVAETEKGLAIFPENAWLLNTSAIALYETADLQKALERASAAVDAAGKVSESEWLTAYPGNDPRSAAAGIATLQRSAADNMHMIQAAIASSTVQSR